MSPSTRKRPALEYRRAAQLLLALTLALAALVATVWVSRSEIATIVYSKPVSGFDEAVLQQMHSTAGTMELQLFEVLTAFGSPVAMVIIAMVGAVWLSVRSTPPIVGAWVAALGGSSGLALGIKHIFGRTRPPGALEYLTGGSYSFPSTHALSSLVGYGMLGYLLSRHFSHTRSTKLLVALTTVAIVATIGGSRLILGVHYFSDVAAGWAAGGIWLSLCICALRWEERGRAAVVVTATLP